MCGERFHICGAGEQRHHLERFIMVNPSRPNVPRLQCKTRQFFWSLVPHFIEENTEWTEMWARLQAQTTLVFIFKVVRNIYARVFPPWQKTAVPILHFREKMAILKKRVQEVSETERRQAIYWKPFYKKLASSRTEPRTALMHTRMLNHFAFPVIRCIRDRSLLLQEWNKVIVQIAGRMKYKHKGDERWNDCELLKDPIKEIAAPSQI